ncbi:MAG: Tex-like N-terminal domain-containing protein, partial [bacterium]
MKNQADYTDILSREFKRKPPVIKCILDLFKEGGTVPFISRYRKEVTGSMDETELRNFEERYNYLEELDKRRETVLKTIGESGKLTDELRKRISNCFDKNELEEIYLPYKPKRKTRALMAKQKGLDPLAEAILHAGGPDSPESLAETMLNQFKDVNDVTEALKGASDIIAEQMAEQTELRARVRDILEKEGIFYSTVQTGFKGQKTKYDLYYDYSMPVRQISSHNMLAIFRGEKEKVLSVEIECDDEKMMELLARLFIKTNNRDCIYFIKKAIEDGYYRLMRPSLVNAVRLSAREAADEEAIANFSVNLRN